MSKQKQRNEGGAASIMDYPAESIPETKGAEVPPAIVNPPVLPPSNDEDPYMSLSEVARHVGKHPTTIMRWVADGLLEVVRVGPLPKIRRSTLAKFLGGSALTPKA